RVESGVPGNGAPAQSAHAQSVLGTSATPLTTPVGVSAAWVSSRAARGSSVTGSEAPSAAAVMPACASVSVVAPAGRLLHRASTGPVMDDPSAFRATGTRIVSYCAPGA